MLRVRLPFFLRAEMFGMRKGEKGSLSGKGRGGDGEGVSVGRKDGRKEGGRGYINTNSKQTEK